MKALRAWRGMLLMWLALPLAAGAAAPPGGSLFAQLFPPAGDGAVAVPFPFAALLDRLRAQLADGSHPLPLVLIPVGRSLQRHSAGDAHYFDTPRVVVAVAGEPRRHDAPLLKDRLYLGYHAAAGVLEVISYHPGAGRFEFEIVEDYRAGATPRLRAGNRGLCLACHQNAAPLFSRPTWDETSANPVIARLLAASGTDIYGLDWRHGVDVPGAIDEATERANLLPVAQTLWREGCADAAREAAIACRGELLWQTLHARLRGAPTAARIGDLPALAPLARNAARWPGGVPIPSADIPNRQPFAATLPWQHPPTDPAELRRLADVAARFDPLALRAPRAHWPLDAAAPLQPWVHALGQFIADVDLRALDRALQHRPHPTRAVPLACDRTVRHGRINLDCRGPAGLRLQARQQDAALAVDRLTLAGAVHGGQRWAADDDGAFRPAGPRPRDGAGLAVDAITIGETGATLTLADDLPPLRAPLDALIAATLAGDSDALADTPLRRAAVLGPLFAALDLPAPPATLAAEAVAAAHPQTHADDPALAPFYQHCGLCHNSPDAFPPGFLHGDAQHVRERIDACAPRMLRRLAMWQVADAAREKTPMPPPAAAQADDIHARGDLPRMQAWLTTRLQAGGHDPATLAARAYADLPDCSIYRD